MLPAHACLDSSSKQVFDAHQQIGPPGPLCNHTGNLNKTIQEDDILIILADSPMQQISSTIQELSVIAIQRLCNMNTVSGCVLCVWSNIPGVKNFTCHAGDAGEAKEVYSGDDQKSKVGAPSSRAP